MCVLETAPFLNSPSFHSLLCESYKPFLNPNSCIYKVSIKCVPLLLSWSWDSERRSCRRQICLQRINEWCFTGVFLRFNCFCPTKLLQVESTLSWSYLACENSDSEVFHDYLTFSGVAFNFVNKKNAKLNKNVSWIFSNPYVARVSSKHLSNIFFWVSVQFLSHRSAGQSDGCTYFTGWHAYVTNLKSIH